MKGREKNYILAIEVTETKRETIRHLFAYYEWKFNKVPIRANEVHVQEDQNNEDFQKKIKMLKKRNTY